MPIPLMGIARYVGIHDPWIMLCRFYSLYSAGLLFWCHLEPESYLSDLDFERDEDKMILMIWFDISLAPMPMIIYAKFMLLIDYNVFRVFGLCYWFDFLPIWFTETIFLAPQCADYSLIKLLKLLWCKCRLKLRLNSLVPYINQTIYCVICSWQFSRQHF